MRLFLGVLVLALLPYPVRSADEKAVRDEQAALKGTWSAVSVKGSEGRELSKNDLDLTQAAWTFKDGGKADFSTKESGGQIANYTYTIDPSRAPKAIDFTYVGPSAQLKGMKQFGIYKLEKDKLTLCLTGPHASKEDRPKELAVDGKDVILLVLQRPAKK